MLTILRLVDACKYRAHELHNKDADGEDNEFGVGQVVDKISFEHNSI